MKSKLNITIKESLVREIKKYAMENKSSVSHLVEEYFEQLTKPVQKTSLTDFLKEIQSADYPEGYNYKEEYYKHREK